MNIFQLTILLLPVTWAIVATVIGIALYKSSEALFESVSGSDKQKRTIRLTGSVVIAALAFYGMKISTPSQNLFVNSPGIKPVSVESLEFLEDQVDAQLSGLVELQACMELDQLGGCRGQLEELESRATDVKSRIVVMIEGEQ